MTEPEVLADEPTPREQVSRSSGIGGSEIASIVGLNPYQSPFDVFLSKAGQEAPRAESAPMRWGKLLQRAIAGAYEEDTGRTLVVCFDEPRRHPNREVVIGTPDALDPNEKRVVELKAPGVRQAWRYGEPGTDQVPDEHLLQCHWYMGLMDYDEADLAVLLGGQQFNIFHIKRDRTLEEALFTQAEKFWREHIVTGIPPAITDTERSREYLRRAFPKHRRDFRRATEEETMVAWAYHSARREREVHEKQEDDFAAQLKLAIGDAEGLEGDGFRLSYRAAKDSVKVDWEAVAGTYEHALRLIGGDVAIEALKAKETLTTVRPGSRRFLPKFEGD